MGERLDASPPVERTPLLERTENSKLPSAVYFYLAAERPGTAEASRNWLAFAN